MRAVSLPDASHASEHIQLQQETAALRNFNSPYVGLGSFTTDAVEATRACMSAVARKRTNSRSSLYVRLVAFQRYPPDAVSRSPVTQPASLEARNTAMRAISSGWPSRPSAVRATMSFSKS